MSLRDDHDDHDEVLMVVVLMPVVVIMNKHFILPYIPKHMKTKMNLGIATFLIASILLGGFSLAGREENILPIENNYELPACSNLSRIYLNQDNDADGLPDFYLYLNSNFSLSGYAHDYTAGQIIRQTETTA